MASKQKIVEKIAQPIAQVLYQRGFRRIDEMMDVVSSCLSKCSFLSREECRILICEIEKQLKEYKYD